MKFTIVLVLAGLMQAGASSFAQSVTYQNKNASIRDVFSAIRQQTGYHVLVSAKNLANVPAVDADFRQSPLKEVLRACLEDLPLTYRIDTDRKTILIKKGRKKSDSAGPPPVPPAEVQADTIHGTVTDSTQIPLPGVSVQVKGTQLGTLTNENGYFELPNPSGNDVLVFSMIGFETQEVQMNGKRSVNVVLKVSMSQLDEIVIVGYGTQKKANLTGAVDVVSSEQLQNRQAATVSQLLQGTSPGMNFQINNQDGFEPGAKMDISIRGIGSLNGGSPYVVIDGIPGDINNLNPEDIASISILKDAAASAIYGARAPYGVILVETKKGSENKKPSITYSTNFSLNTPQPLPGPLDSYTWTRGMHYR